MRTAEGEVEENGQVLLQVSLIQFGAKEAEASLVYRQKSSAVFSPHTDDAVTGRYVATLLIGGYSPFGG